MSVISLISRFLLDELESMKTHKDMHLMRSLMFSLENHWWWKGRELESRRVFRKRKLHSIIQIRSLLSLLSLSGSQLEEPWWYSTNKTLDRWHPADLYLSTSRAAKWSSWFLQIMLTRFSQRDIFQDSNSLQSSSSLSGLWPSLLAEIGSLLDADLPLETRN